MLLFVVSCFLIIAVVRENIRVKLPPSIPTGVPTISEEIVQTAPLVALKTIKILSM